MPPRRPPPRQPKAAPKTEAQDESNATATPEAAASSETGAGTSSNTALAEPSNTESDLAASNTPSRSDTTPSAPAARGRGGRPIARPRGVGRRSQGARAELAKEEAERKRIEAEAKSREDVRKRRTEAARSRGAFRGRQRGGYMGEGERKKEDAVASGPFSLGQVASDAGARRRPTWGGSRPGGGGDGGGRTYTPGGVKREPGGDVDMTDVHIKTEDGGYISSDEDDESGRRVEKQNVDDLAFIDLTGEEEAPIPVFAPVRLHRVEHKDRSITLNADATTKADGTVMSAETNDITSLKESDKKKGKRRAKDVEITGESHRYKGTYDSSSDQDVDPQVKAEPTDDDDVPDVPEAVAADGISGMNPQSPPTSPETKRKAKERIKDRASFSSDIGVKPSFQTKEEETEWEIQQKDLRVLRSELGKLTLPSQQPPTDTADGTQEVQAVDDPRADKVYLFQFPPILPDLLPISVKPDPDADPTNEEADAMDVDKATTTAPQVQHDEDEGPPPGSRPPKLPSGMVGKLRIHASGRATLDWGGTPLDLAMGGEASFLQDVLIADLPVQPIKEEGDVKTEDVGEIKAGKAMAMGQVKGKFILTPDWDAIIPP